MVSHLAPETRTARPSASDFFAAEEFGEWSTFDRLLEEEKVLLRRYLLALPRDSRVLDVGTGAGRWLLRLADEGFTSLTGIDLCTRLLDVGREKAAQRGLAIDLQQQNASQLGFAEESFDVVIALQQLVSVVGGSEARARTLQNFQRVLAPGGLLLVSALSWEARWMNRWIGMAIAPLKLLKGDRNVLQPQYLPWLKLGGKPNVRFPFEAQPYAYWFRKAEFERDITAAGLELIETTTTRMLVAGSEEFAFGGMLFAIARKPAAAATACLTSSTKEGAANA